MKFDDVKMENLMKEWIAFRDESLWLENWTSFMIGLWVLLGIIMISIIWLGLGIV